GVGFTLDALQRRGLQLRTLHSGERLRSGSLEMEVLHPPRQGPAGVENVRSLVLLVRHGPHRFLLTGDLEGEGLALLLRQPARPVDMLMAPHHGSRRIGDLEGLLAWAGPRLIVSCQGLPRGPGAPE